jgi:hypothetical protein
MLKDLKNANAKDTNEEKTKLRMSKIGGGYLSQK